MYSILLYTKGGWKVMGIVQLAEEIHILFQLNFTHITYVRIHIVIEY